MVSSVWRPAAAHGCSIVFVADNCNIMLPQPIIVTLCAGAAPIPYLRIEVDDKARRSCDAVFITGLGFCLSSCCHVFKRPYLTFLHSKVSSLCPTSIPQSSSSTAQSRRAEGCLCTALWANQGPPPHLSQRLRLQISSSSACTFNNEISF